MTERWRCGHPRTPENTAKGPQCRECRLASWRRYGASLKGRERTVAHDRLRVRRGEAAIRQRRVRERRRQYAFEVFSASADRRVILEAPIERAVILSDIQMPFEDPAALNEALGVIGAVKPDLVVLNGDVVDCYLESDFLRDPRFRTTATREGHRRARHLMEVLRGIPHKIWLGGNHEDRWRRLIWGEFQNRGSLSAITQNLLAAMETRGEDIDPENHVTSFAAIFDMPRYGFRYYPYGYRLYLAGDNLVVTHGRYVSRHSGYSAKRTFEWLGRSCIVGHTHRLGNYLITQDGRTHGAWENGCLCLLNPEYEDNPNWQQGFSVVRIRGDEFHVIQVPIVQRGGKPVAVYHGGAE